ncbi:MAG TPA: hypothetical protein VGL63_15725 [Streptosporangiaceae bacterium]|jgi:hypothetical protein
MDNRPDGSAKLPAVVPERPRRRSRLHAATTAVGTACVLGTTTAAGVAGTMPTAAHASIATAARAGSVWPSRPAATSARGSVHALAALAPPASMPVAASGPSHATSGGS